MNVCVLCTVRISNAHGMHLRAAGEFVRLAERFNADICVENDGRRVNGKSIMGLLSLASAEKAVLSISAIGNDADAAAAALSAFVENGFVPLPSQNSQLGTDGRQRR